MVQNECQFLPTSCHLLYKTCKCIDFHLCSLPLSQEGSWKCVIVLLTVDTKSLIFSPSHMSCREEFDIEKRTQKSVVGNAVYLIVKNVSTEDAGEFTCQVQTNPLQRNTFYAYHNHRRQLLKLDKKTRRHLALEVCIQWDIWTTPHTLQYGISLTPSPMPHWLREMANRWCNWFVCLVITIEVYVKTCLGPQSTLPIIKKLT